VPQATKKAFSHSKSLKLIVVVTQCQFTFIQTNCHKKWCDLLIAWINDEVSLKDRSVVWCSTDVMSLQECNESLSVKRHQGDGESLFDKGDG
jgi:hypothetical protein